MQKFELILMNSKRKVYDRFAIFLFLLNGAGILIALYHTKNQINNKSVYFSFLAIAILLMISPSILVSRKATIRYLKAFLFASVALSLYWVFLGYWWIGVVAFALTLLYIAIQKELKVGVEQDKILYPSFPTKTISWNTVANMILKDGVLTIDFKNNNLIQQPIDESKTSVNEKEFNDFCREQLRNAGSSI